MVSDREGDILHSLISSPGEGLKKKRLGVKQVSLSSD